MKLATESELDLVEVAPEARPPVVKLMDFGKFKYESAMKERAARKNQANTVLKEIRYRLKIDDHDYATKTGHVTRFLKAGDKVKVMIMFRGREQSRPEMGLRLLQRVAADVEDLGSVESTPRVDGRNMVMVIGPHKKKAEVKTEAKAAKQAQKDAASAPAADTASTATEAAPEHPGRDHLAEHHRRDHRGLRPAPADRRPARADRSTHGAEDEDALRCEEALQGDGHGQDHARAAEQPAPVRVQELAPQAQAGPGQGAVALGDQDREEAPRHLSSPRPPGR